MGKISGPCKAAAKKKFEVWPSAYLWLGCEMY